MNGLSILLWLCAIVAILLVLAVVVPRVITMSRAIAATNRSLKTLAKRYEFTTSTSAQRVIDAMEQNWEHTATNGAPGFYVQAVQGDDQVTLMLGNQAIPRIFAAEIRFESSDPASGTLSFTDLSTATGLGLEAGRALGRCLLDGAHPAEQLKADFAGLIADLAPGAVLREDTAPSSD